MAGPTLPLSLPPLLALLLLLHLLPLYSPQQLIPPTPPVSPSLPSPAPTTTTTTTPTDPHPGGLVSFTGGRGSYRRMAREFLDSHNAVRTVEGEAPFVWNSGLARYARRWAKQRREKCDTTHSGGPYGENMFWGTGWDWRARDAVEHWANESLYYNRIERSCWPGKMCGHFTQIVWNSTVRVGCARVECFQGGVVMSCNYDPPGNYVGEDPFTS